jgi:hypothetical protein
MKNKIFKLKILLLATIAISVMVFSSCFNDYGLTESDYDIVLTLNDTSADFTTYKTFIIPDSVVQLGGSGGNAQYNSIMLNTFVNQLESKGYTRVYPSDTVRADLVALISTTTTNNYVITTDFWSYWGWYGWGSYYPWGPGYSYPPVYAGYSFTTGTMLMNLIDIAKSDTTNKKVATVWLGALNGVLESDNVSERIVNGVNQAFTQSPYIRRY